MGSAVSSEISKRAFLPPPSTYSSTLESIEWAEGEDGTRIPYVFFSHPDATNTILFSHGNAEDLGDLQAWMRYLSIQLKVNACAYDYPGYGICCPDEAASEEGCYRAVEIMFEHLLGKGIPAQSILLWGRSLGSGPTVHLAHKLSIVPSRSNDLLSCLGNDHMPDMDCGHSLIGGVILQSPIASAIRVVSSALAFRVFDIFENIHKIDVVRPPVMIVHGKKDMVVPFEHGVQLYQACKSGFRFLPLEDAGHNDIELKHAETLLGNVTDMLEMIQEKNNRKEDSSE